MTTLETNPFADTLPKIIEVSPVRAEISKQLITGSKADMIEAAFAPMVTMLRGFDAEIEAIKSKPITEETTQEAKALRLKLVKIRTTTAKIHKEQKDDALKEGRAIDGVKNILEYAVSSQEKSLFDIENHFVNIEKERKRQLFDDRVSKLIPFIPEMEAKMIPLGEMNEDAFNNLVNGFAHAHEAKLKAEADQKAQQAEQERLKKEDDARIRAENDRMKVAAKEMAESLNRKLDRINKLTSIGLTWSEQYSSYVSEVNAMNIGMVEIEIMTDEEFNKVYSSFCKTMDAHNLKIKKAQESTENKLKQEREERKRLEAEAQAKADQEEQERKAKIAADRKLKRAPDREKLLALSNQIALLECAPLKDEEYKAILNNAIDLLAKVQAYINKKVQELD